MLSKWCTAGEELQDTRATRSQWCALPHWAHPCQVQQGLPEQDTSKERKKGTFLRMSDNHNLFSSFLPGLWQNHSKFYSVLLYEYKNLKLIPLRKAAISCTLKSMISSDDFRFIVPEWEKNLTHNFLKIVMVFCSLPSEDSLYSAINIHTLKAYFHQVPSMTFRNWSLQIRKKTSITTTSASI